MSKQCRHLLEGGYGLKNNSFGVRVVDQYKEHWVQSGQALSDAENDADRAHDSDQSKALHPDWRESSGIILPTVEELHYAHHFLNRAVERRLREVSPGSELPPRTLSIPQSTCGYNGI
jgi:hypothetical protein